jgi:hypothetical protein
MAYPPGTTVWVAGQRLDAADLNNWMQNLPWGRVGHASITSNSSAFTTVADVSGLSVAFTALADRYYVASFSGIISSTVSLDRIDVQITDSANTVLKESINFIPGNSAPMTCHFATAPLEPGAGSVTYKIRAERVSGTGSCIIVGAATNPAVITVMDVGPA